MDGATGHLDTEAAELAKTLNIDILLLPSHTTHILQVADVSIFHAFKAAWRAECAKRRLEKRRTCVRGETGISKTDIIPLAVNAWDRAVTPSNVIAGFRRTGIYPYDPLAYKRTVASHLRTESLTGLPSLLSPQSLGSQEMKDCTLLLNLIAGPSFSDPSPSTAPVKPVRRMLNTSAGALITGAETLGKMRQWDEERKAEEDEKSVKRQKKAERKVEILQEGEEKAKRKVEREARRIAKAEAQQKERVKVRKRKVKAVMSDASTEDEGNKENAHPNLPHINRRPPSSRKTAYTCTVLTVGSRSLLRLRAVKKVEEPVESKRNGCAVM